MSDLTRVDWVKERLHLRAGDTNFCDVFDDLLERIISEASEAVQTYLDRDLEQQEFHLWLNGTGRRRISLPVAPVTNVYYAAQCPSNAMKITGPTHSQIAVVAGTSLLLRELSSGTWSTTTIDLTSDTTHGAVKTAVDAVDDWSATDVDDSNAASDWLQPLSLTAAEDGAFIQYPEPIPAYMTAGGQRHLYSDLDNAGSSNYLGFDYGVRNIYVHCQAGYTLPTEIGDVTGTLPTDLVGVVHDIIEEVFRGLVAAQELVDVTGDNSGGGAGAVLSSISIDDYSEGYSTAGGGAGGGSFSTARLSEGIAGAVASRAKQLAPWRLVRVSPGVTRNTPARIV